MTLLSSKRFGSPLLAKEEEKGEGEKGSKIFLDSAFRMELPSKCKRDALCVNIASPAAPGQVLRLFNVHLDSLDALFRRMLQMSMLAGALREAGCGGGIIAGDFNAIYPKDHDLIDVDLENGRKPERLDKVVMLCLQLNEIEVLQRGRIGLE